MRKVFSGLIYCNISFYKASGVGFYTNNFYTLLLKSWKAFCNLSECKTLNDQSLIIYFGLFVDEIFKTDCVHLDAPNKVKILLVLSSHPKEAGL